MDFLAFIFIMWLAGSLWGNMVAKPQDTGAYDNQGKSWALSSFDKSGATGASNEVVCVVTGINTTVEAYKEQGDAKYEKQDYRGAIKDYTKAIELDPEDALALDSRGSAKDELGDHAGAIDDFTKAIELSPNFGMPYFFRGCAKLNLKDYGKAIDDFIKAIELCPNFPDAYFKRGNAKSDLQDHSGAIEDFTTAMELYPGYEKTYDKRGMTKANLLDFNKAMEGPSAKSIKDAEAYLKQGNLDLIAEDATGAIESYTNAIKLNPRLALAYFKRGLVKYYLKDFKGAILDYTEVLNLNQYNTKDYSGANYGGAKTEALSQDDHARADLCAAAYYNRGMAEYDVGDYKGSSSDHFRAIEIDPKYDTDTPYSPGY